MYPNPFIRLFFTVFCLYLLTLFSTAHAQGQPTVEQVCSLTQYDIGGHAFWLSHLPGDPSTDYLFDAAGGTLTFYSDSSAQVTGRIIHEQDSSRQWDTELWLVNKRTYTEWTALGRRLKIGGGPTTADQQNWIFYELDSTRSILRGVPGTHYDGDSLLLLHRPGDFTFGFQLGIGANDKNAQYGLSGWFDFDGSFSGRGDLNSIVDCSTAPPICDVAIDTFYAACKTDSTFEIFLSISGSGNDYQITDDQGSAAVGGLAAGTYSYGEYFNSTDVVLTVSDTNFTNCIANTLPVTADCTPVAVCDLVVDTVYTQCITDSTFTLMVTFQGSGSQFRLFDNLGTPPMLDISAGTYSFGTYSQDTVVNLTVLDFSIFNCYSVLGPFSDSCSTDTTSSGTQVANFSAVPGPQAMYLSWVTTREYQNDGFEIQRSADGRIYQPIGYEPGAYNSASELSYTFADHTAKEGIQYYYRLKLTRFDGHIRYSNVIESPALKERRLVVGPIMPNPVRFGARVSIIAEQEGLSLDCMIVDAMGRVQAQENTLLAKGFQTLKIDCAKLKPGLYFMQFQIQAEVVSAQRMLITE